MSKICNQCKESKTLDCFSKNKATKDSLDNKCRSCHSINGKKLVESGYYREKYLLNKKKILAQMKVDAPKYRERKKITGRVWKNNNKHKLKQYRIKGLGIISSSGELFTMADYEKEVLKCGNNCMICSKSAEINGKCLAIDHDHETGIYRGLLCSTCNVALGLANDNTLILKRMIKYLKQSRDGGGTI